MTAQLVSNYYANYVSATWERETFNTSKKITFRQRLQQAVNLLKLKMYHLVSASFSLPHRQHWVVFVSFDLRKVNVEPVATPTIYPGTKTVNMSQYSSIHLIKNSPKVKLWP